MTTGPTPSTDLTAPADLTPVADACRPRRRNDDGGQTLILFTLGIFVIMGMAAFVVDLGYWYTQAAKMQRAADAAALAGVIYMPGQFSPNAQQVADNVAADNGFSSSDPGETVTVSPVPDQPQDLSVSITDNDIPTFFAKVFGLDKVTETRSSVAQYDPSIPLGSPENSFGTGSVPLNDGTVTNIWAAVNGYCTSKEYGDEYLSGEDFSYTSPTCPNSLTPPAVLNNEYNPNGYFYDITTPNATGTLGTPLTVRAYDPEFHSNSCPTTPSTPDAPDTGLTNSAQITTYYSLFYDPTPEIPGSETPVAENDADPTYASPNYNTTTPADVFTTNETSACDQWVNLFTLPVTAQSGEYRLEVYTESKQVDSDGVNSYGLEVYSGSSFSRCTTIPGVAGLSSTTCPTIHGDSSISVYAQGGATSSGQQAQTGTFYLASINSQYIGKTMLINLFDPGDGDHYIQVIDPDGNPVPFTYEATDYNTGCPDCAQQIGLPQINLQNAPASPGLDVSQTLNGNAPAGESNNWLTNDRHIQLALTIPADTADNGGWWMIKYTALTGVPVTDRTTWSVSIPGAPVHLVG